MRFDVNIIFADGCVYYCPSCNMSFRFPYSLRAHMRFRCQNHESQKVKTLQPSPTTPSSYTEYFTKDNSRIAKSLYNPYHHVIKCNVFSPSDPRGGLVPSPTSSISPGTTSNGSSSPPCTESSNTASATHPLTPEEKIRYSESDSSSNDTLFSAPLNLKRSSHRKLSHEDDIKNKRQKIDQNQNITSTHRKHDEENLSAFYKVEKHISPPKRVQDTSSFQIGTMATTSLMSSHSSLFGNTSQNADKLLASQHHKHLMAKFLPMLPPGGLPAAYLPGLSGSTGAPENLRNLSEFYGHALNIGGAASPPNIHRSRGFDDNSSLRNHGETDSLMNMRNIISPASSSPSVFPAPSLLNVPPRSQTDSFLSQPPGQFRSPLQFYRSPNPVVDKLLSSTTLPTNGPSASFTPLVPNTLMQNWCAKCNATFRMTSDLVYHMRSHHKSVNGMTVKKKEDKLKCTICSETFKERHHLTRHMSSHM